MEKMKNSGIEWIGDIPEGWEVTRFKYQHTGLNTGEAIDKIFWSSDEDKTYFYTAGVEPIHSTYQNFPKWKYTQDNDILLARNGTPYVYFPFTNAIYSDHIIRSAIKCEIDKRFIRYTLQQSISSVVVDTVSIATWSASLWNEQYIPLPPPETQKRIADFLDEKCVKIDGLKNDIQKQIETLEQYKKSVITEAVTKGINPNTKMKDSGIDDVGQIPESWEEKKIKFLFDLVNDQNHLPMDKVQLLSLYTELGVFPHGEQEERGNKAVTVEGYKKVKKNDLVVNIILAWMGAMGISNYDGVTSPAYDIYRPKSENANPKYYHYLFRTPWFAGECDKYGRGIMRMRWRTYSQEFMNIKIPYPSAEEQKQIADYLDEKCSSIDSIISTKKQQLEKLEEYKKSLIFEYVTGKKQVFSGEFSSKTSGKKGI